MLVSTRFQVLFHSPPGVLFTFPSRYCSTIGHQVVFRLGWWSTLLPAGFLVSRGTPDTRCYESVFKYEALTLFGVLSHTLRLNCGLHIVVRTPKVLLPSVWPLPRSLATTYGISVDFSSSPYLDVSVQAVPSVCLCIQHTVTGLGPCRVSPFGDPRIIACFRLPEAFRRSLRPSSAPSAKASPLRSF